MKFSSDYQPKNRGRKKGSVNKTTSLLRNATPDILAKLIKKAKDGDVQAASTVLKHSLPPVRPESRTIALQIPHGATLSAKAELIANAALEGKCCPSMASQLITALGTVSRIVEMDDILRRLEVLENAR